MSIKVFLSHWSQEGSLASAWKRLLVDVLGPGTEVFYSSDPEGGVATGDWRAQVEAKLAQSDVVLLLVTPLSKEKPWLYLEYGFAWGRDRSIDQSTIVAPVTYYLKPEELPSGLSNLQIYSGDQVSSVKKLVNSISKTLVGNVSSDTIVDFVAKRYKEEILEYSKKIADEVLFLGKFHRRETGEELEGKWYAKWTELPEGAPEKVFEFHSVRVWTTEERLRVVGRAKVGARFYPMEGVVSSLGHIALSYWSEGTIPYCGTTVLRLVEANRYMVGFWEGFTAKSLEAEEPRHVRGRVVMGRDEGEVRRYWGVLPPGPEAGDSGGPPSSGAENGQ